MIKSRLGRDSEWSSPDTGGASLFDLSHARNIREKL